MTTTATPERARRVREAAGTPATPLQVNVTQELSHDVIMAATIPVDTTSETPVAVFDNPAGGGVPGNTRPEALAVVPVQDAPPQFAHIAPDTSADGGWTKRTPFGGTEAVEVAAGTAYPGSSQSAVYAFLSDGTTLRTSLLQSDGVTWSTPQPVGDRAVTGLRAAYSPAGRLVLYGADPDGNLVTCYQQAVGGPFTMTVCSLPGGLGGDFRLVLTDESSWTLVANIGEAPMLVLGALGDTAASVADLPEYDGTLKQVVVGFWNPVVNTAVFALVDTDDTLRLWSQTPLTTVVQSPGPALSTASATGHVSTDDSLHLYVQDTSLKLWVLHMDPDTPWNEDGTPNWSPPIPLDTGIAGVASSGVPADAPTLFAIDAAIGSLRLHVQDPQTLMWRSGTVLASSAEATAYEVVRYRTEASVMDANGAPVPNYPVTLAAAAGSSACELSCAGSTVTVGSEPVSLTTDAMGKLTMAMLVTAGLSAPAMTLDAEGLTAPIDVRPASGVLTYLSGKGTLNPTHPDGPLPQFDAGGDTLTAAVVDGGPLAPGATGSTAPVAAAGIQNTAQSGLGGDSSGRAGYRLQLRGREPRFTILRTPEELARALSEAGGEPDSFWSDIERWAGDIWEGIKNGLVDIVDAVVDAATAIATFTVQIGDEIAKGINLAVAGIEQAAHFISGVFAWVEAEVDKVIDWLKALFDFGAIWRTKMAFEQAINLLPAYVKAFVDHYGSIAEGWFTAQEQSAKKAFTAAVNAAEGRQFNALPGFQQPPPSTSPSLVGSTTAADYSQNVHHNWLQDKVSSSAPEDTGLSAYQPAQDPWQAFSSQLSNAEGDFVGAISGFAGALQTLIEHPDTFGTTGVADLLTGVEGLVDSGLDLADAMVSAYIGLSDIAMDGLTELLAQELDWGPVNTLWQWMADAAGYPDDGRLTVGALTAMLAAFPTTVVYKLVEGAHGEPFPSGTFAPGSGLARGGLPGEVPEGYRIASGILQAFYYIPAMISDLLGPKAPGWVTLTGLVWTGLIWATYHGLSIEDVLEGGAIALVALVLVLKAVPMAALQVLQEQLSPVSTDIAAVVLTLVGVAELTLTGYETAEHELDDYEIAAGFLLPIPDALAFLNLGVIRRSAAGPYCIGAKCVFDFVGCVPGGILQMKNAIAS
ncbi:hypothetical protein [Streptomyces sp. NPDC048603]|uniref:hypothetical protein n=1 Tax=Streptomyces sp. NPDC048603 TaxID=3365577 RepID=UPI00371541A4